MVTHFRHFYLLRSLALLLFSLLVVKVQILLLLLSTFCYLLVPVNVHTLLFAYFNSTKYIIQNPKLIYLIVNLDI